MTGSFLFFFFFFYFFQRDWSDQFHAVVGDRYKVAVAPKRKNQDIKS